jgi:hypothetical protein
MRVKRKRKEKKRKKGPDPFFSYLVALRAADARDYGPLLAFVRS